MMAHAYPEMYLANTQSALGDAFDYATNACGITGNDFAKLFITSSISKRMENGEPAIIAGKSGIEIAIELIYDTTGENLEARQYEQIGHSAEYWIGWAVAYYQWYSSRRYVEIFNALPFDDLKECITPSTKRILQSLLKSQIKKSRNTLKTPISKEFAPCATIHKQNLQAFQW